MAHQSNHCTGLAQATALLERVSHLGDDWRLAQAMHLQLQEMGLPRVNLLLVGPDSVTHHLLELLLPELSNPIATWCPGEHLVLPPLSFTGTMIFHDIGALGRDDQWRLLEHLGCATGALQIVSTSPTPLLPRIHAGTFDDTLYYRLNHIYLDSNPQTGRPL
jgi:hypothetical protein